MNPLPLSSLSTTFAARPPAAASEGARVLIVDDEEMIRENLMAYLEDEGIPVTAVASGEEALRCLAEGGQFAVCIMDMRLPGMDGNTSIRQLHARCPRLRFIIHTGSSDYSLPNDLRGLGLSEASIYLKPLLDMAPLARAVSELLARARRGDQR